MYGSEASVIGSAAMWLQLMLESHALPFEIENFIYDQTQTHDPFNGCVTIADWLLASQQQRSSQTIICSIAS